MNYSFLLVLAIMMTALAPFALIGAAIENKSRRENRENRKDCQ